MIVSVLLGLQPGMASAQIAPMAPVFPKSDAECQQYASEVDAFQASVEQQHQACLAEGIHDRPNEPPDSAICSRSSC